MYVSLIGDGRRSATLKGIVKQESHLSRCSSLNDKLSTTPKIQNPRANLSPILWRNLSLTPTPLILHRRETWLILLRQSKFCRWMMGAQISMTILHR